MYPYDKAMAFYTYNQSFIPLRYYIVIRTFKGNKYTFTGGTCNSVKILTPFWNGVFSKTIDCYILEPIISSFLEGTWSARKQTEGYESCLPCKNNSKYFMQVYQVPLNNFSFLTIYKCIKVYGRFIVRSHQWPPGPENIYNFFRSELSWIWKFPC